MPVRARREAAHLGRRVSQHGEFPILEMSHRVRRLLFIQVDRISDRAREQEAPCAAVPESSRHVVFRELLAWRREDPVRSIVLDQAPEPEERRVVRHPGRLLHVVRDDHDGVLLLQLVDQLLDPLRGDGSRADAGSSISRTSGSTARRGRCTGAAAGRRRARAPTALQPVLDFVPQRGAPAGSPRPTSSQVRASVAPCR